MAVHVVVTGQEAMPVPNTDTNNKQPSSKYNRGPRLDSKNKKKRWCYRHAEDGRDGMDDNKEKEGDGDGQ